MRKLLHGEILQKRLTIDESKEVWRHPVTVVLDNIRSLYNVGSIFRTCDSALVSELLLCGFTPFPPRKEIEKTALGAVDTVPWTYFQSTIEAIPYLKNKGNKIIAVEITDNLKKYNQLRSEDYPCALIFGNELTGIDDEILSLCDFSIEIPMYGVKHSLNVAVAVGIATYESIRIFNKFKNIK
ncbi:MAG: RNA methyltransferase [Candidatus Kapabacteria bacterium]|nr:RNA methyltransferase [Candidatus Kapabacteria bacterium]